MLSFAHQTIKPLSRLCLFYRQILTNMTYRNAKTRLPTTKNIVTFELVIHSYNLLVPRARFKLLQRSAFDFTLLSNETLFQERRK